MFKKILGNSQGVTLIETVAAMGISVLLAAGIMRMNSNASKGMSRIMSKSDLLDFKNDLRRQLSQYDGVGQPVCTAGFIAAFGADTSGVDTAASLTVGTITLTAGQPLPTVESIRLNGISRNAFVSSGGGEQGRCDLVLNLTNERDRQQGSYNLTIPVSCLIASASAPVDNDMVRCSSADGVGIEGLGELYTDNINRDHMVFDPASLTTFGINPNHDVSTGAMTIVTTSMNNFLGTGVIGPASNRNAIDLNLGDSILWGPNYNGSDSIGIYGNRQVDLENNGIKDHIHLAAETIRIENPVSGAATLDLLGQLNAQNVYAAAYFYTSDKRLKKDITDLNREGSVSDKLEDIRGVTYFMRRDEFPELNLSDRKQIGLIAQEVEEIFPELIETNPMTGFKSVSYGNFVAILIEAFKEQREEIKANRELLSYLEGRANLKDYEQDSRIEALEQENEQLRDRIEDLERKIEYLFSKEEESTL